MITLEQAEVERLQLHALGYSPVPVKTGDKVRILPAGKNSVPPPLMKSSLGQRDIPIIAILAS